jgi:hypothetical protein
MIVGVYRCSTDTLGCNYRLAFRVTCVTDLPALHGALKDLDGVGVGEHEEAGVVAGHELVGSGRLGIGTSRENLARGILVDQAARALLVGEDDRLQAVVRGVTLVVFKTLYLFIVAKVRSALCCCYLLDGVGLVIELPLVEVIVRGEVRLARILLQLRVLLLGTPAAQPRTPRRAQNNTV